MGKHFKVCPLGKARMEKKVPSTLCLLSLPPSSRNTLHTDRAHQSIQNPPNNVSCTGSTSSECAIIKTRKLLLVGNVERIARSFSGSIVAVMGDDIKCEKEGVRN